MGMILQIHIGVDSPPVSLQLCKFVGLLVSMNIHSLQSLINTHEALGALLTSQSVTTNLQSTVKCEGQLLFQHVNSIVLVHTMKPHSMPRSLNSCKVTGWVRTTEQQTSHKKFSEGKQVHVGMEPSKTNQTRWE